MSSLIRLLCCGDTENSLLEVQQMTELGCRERGNLQLILRFGTELSYFGKKISPISREKNKTEVSG